MSVDLVPRQEQESLDNEADLEDLRPVDQLEELVTKFIVKG
jgi:hypothetical protein